VTEPVRTCVGCRRRAAWSELVRLRLEGNQVIFVDEKTSGRGAWLHAREECLDLALRRHALGRALRRPQADIDPLALRLGLTGNARKY
jgi:hypothetical protein